ncbi:MAG: putative Ig domain-containing protein, partial [Solirubrobacteraceae bacterium]
GVPGPALGQALCGSSVAVHAPGRGPHAVKASQGLRLRRLRSRSGRVGVPVRVRVRVRARDSRRLHLRYRASGLPTGLSINSRTGVISGRPRRPGLRRVHVRVWDSRGTATLRFRWTVTARRHARELPQSGTR